MNTFEFFHNSFGKHLTNKTNKLHMDAWRALSSNHPQQKKNAKGEHSSCRLISGWAIVRPDNTLLQQKLAATGLTYDDRNRFNAFFHELQSWDGSPRIFLTFDQSPVPIANLFMTLDLRAVRICSPSGVETFDYTTAAPSNAGTIGASLHRMKEKQDAA